MLKLRIDQTDAWIFEPKPSLAAAGAIWIGEEFETPELEVFEGGKPVSRVQHCTTDKTVFVLVTSYYRQKYPALKRDESQIEIPLPRPEDLEKEWKEARKWVKKRAPWDIRVEEIDVADH